MCHPVNNALLGVISGALLYIRDDFAAVEKSTVLRVRPVSSSFTLVQVKLQFSSLFEGKKKLNHSSCDVFFLQKERKIEANM